ncbi:hypothetical protein H4S03_008064, partial [Coemansia sp. S3946]
MSRYVLMDQAMEAVAVFVKDENDKGIRITKTRVVELLQSEYKSRRLLEQPLSDWTSVLFTFSLRFPEIDKYMETCDNCHDAVRELKYASARQSYREHHDAFRRVVGLPAKRSPITKRKPYKTSRSVRQARLKAEHGDSVKLAEKWVSDIRRDYPGHPLSRVYNVGEMPYTPTVD